MIVMKFGGTSVGNAHAISNVCSIIESKQTEKPVVIVSAVKNMTDTLIASAKSATQGHVDIGPIERLHTSIVQDLGVDCPGTEELLTELLSLFESICEAGHLSTKDCDHVVSFGERLSARLVAAALHARGIPAQAHDAFDIGFVTDDRYGGAEVLPQTFNNIFNSLAEVEHIPIVTGFIAKNEDDCITTLGRGGSDYSAAIVGSALGAGEIQIWTDVTGVKSADPRIIPHAETIDHMSFAEASELAYFGAKVLHPKTILPAIDKDIPVKVLNTFYPDSPGTTIVHRRNDVTPGRIKAITVKRNITTITVTSSRMLHAVGFLEKLFRDFAQNDVAVDMLATTEVSVSATVSSKVNVEQLVEDISQYATVHVENDKAILCVVGEGLKDNASTVAGILFRCLGSRGIHVDMISQGSSEINISMVVEAHKANEAVLLLHHEFFVR